MDAVRDVLADCGWRKRAAWDLAPNLNPPTTSIKNPNGAVNAVDDESWNLQVCEDALMQVLREEVPKVHASITQGRYLQAQT